MCLYTVFATFHIRFVYDVDIVQALHLRRALLKIVVLIPYIRILSWSRVKHLHHTPTTCWHLKERRLSFSSYSSTCTPGRSMLSCRIRHKHAYLLQGTNPGWLLFQKVNYGCAQLIVFEANGLDSEPRLLCSHIIDGIVSPDLLLSSSSGSIIVGSNTGHKLQVFRLDRNQLVKSAPIVSTCRCSTVTVLLSSVFFAGLCGFCIT